MILYQIIIFVKALQILSKSHSTSIMIQIIFIVTFVLLLAYLVLIVIYFIGWRKIKFFVPQTTAPKTNVSVIIAARNEEINVVNLLQDLDKQDYPLRLLEIIFVDDDSTDETSLLIKTHASPETKLISMKTNNLDASAAYKKRALAKGIAISSGELILTTDADCRLNPKWISTIVKYYEQCRPDMIVMPVVMTHKRKVSGIFQHLDFMFMQGITAASISNKFTMMCNGANLAYTRKAFDAVGGFENIDHVASGDDMLLMQKIATLDKNKIMYLKSSAVIVKTEAQNNWIAFLHQRMRWAGKSTSYLDASLLPTLLLVFTFNLFLLIAFVTSIFFNDVVLIFGATLHVWTVMGSFLLFKISVELLLLLPVSRFFKSNQWLPLYPVLQPLHIIYIVVAALLSKTLAHDWKGRRGK